MKKKAVVSSDAEELRRKAKRRMKKIKQPERAAMTNEELRRVVQELEIHRIELEITNEDLLQSRAEVEAGLEQYSSLYDFAPVGYLSVERDGKIRRINLTCALMLGVDRGKLLKQRFGFFVADESRATFAGLVQDVLGSKKNSSCQLSLLGEGGRKLHAQLEATCNKDGKECDIAVIDLTERMRAEEALRKNEERLRTVVEFNRALEAEVLLRTQAEESLQQERSLLLTLIHNLPDEVCLKDLESRYLMANPACIKALGAGSLNAMIGKTDRDYVRLDIAAEQGAEEKAILESGKPLINQERTHLDLKTGAVISSFLATKVPVIADNGESVGLLVINRDITERKQAEMALRESEKRFRSVWECDADGMRLTDSSGRIVDVNDAFCRLVKLTRDELVGEVLSKPFRGESPHGDVAMYRKRFASGEIIPRYTGKLQLWNGDDVDVEVLNTLVETGPGSKIKLSIFRDVTDRVRAEERVKEERNLLRTVIDALPDEVAVKNRERRFVLVNHSTVESLNRKSEEEVIGLRDEDLIPEEFACLAKSEEENVLATGEPFVEMAGRSRINSESGRIERSILISKIPLRDQSGKTIGLVSINRDVTELKQAGQKIRDQYSTLQAITESTESPIFSLDGNYCYTSFNSNHAAHMKAMYDATIELGHNLLDYQTVPSDRAKAKANLDKAMRGERFVDAAYSGDQARTRIYVEVSHNPIRAANGEVTGVAVFVRDTTKERRAEEALKESEELYRTLVDTSPDAITVTDLEGNVSICSNRTAQLFGFENPDQIRGRNAFEMIALEDRERAALNLRRTLEEGASRDLEYIMVRADGSRFFGSISSALIRDAAGNPKAFIGIIRDVTEYKRMEAEHAYQTLLHKFRSEISYLISRPDPIGETLRRSVEVIVSHFEIACAQIWMLGENLVLQAHAGARTVCGTPENRARIGGIIARATMKENRAIIRNGLAADPLFVDVSWENCEGIMAYAGLPLYVEGRLVGVLVVFSNVPLREPTMSPLAGATVTIAQGILRKEAEHRLRDSQEQLRTFASHMETIREEERKHLARELHDELGQSLTALKMDLASLARDLLENGGSIAVPSVEKINSMTKIIDQTVEYVQNIALELRPDVLDTLGLVDAVEWYTEEFQRRSGVVCNTRLSKKRFDVDEQVATALFRILQEALTNVARHSGAQRVDVTLSKTDGEVILSVQDNGRGIGEREKSSHSSLGLLGMSERMLSLDGRLEIIGVPGQGTRISARIPVLRRNVTTTTTGKGGK